MPGHRPALIQAGYDVFYRWIFDAVRDFLHDEAFDGHDKVMAKYLKPDLLILDDMGLKHLPKRSGEFLFEIIMRRHEIKSTMMTSNRPLEDWGKLIGDVPAATAILDRLLARGDHSNHRQELSAAEPESSVAEIVDGGSVMALTARRNSISGVHRSSPVVCVRYTRSWAVDFWRKTVCGGERGFSRHDRTKERQQHFAAFEPACEAKRPVDHAIAGRDGTVLPSWPGYPSAGCSPAEPASVSPDSAILLLRTGQRLKQNSKPAKRDSGSSWCCSDFTAS